MKILSLFIEKLLAERRVERKKERKKDVNNRKKEKYRHTDRTKRMAIIIHLFFEKIPNLY
jgi:hypothetical protein